MGDRRDRRDSEIVWKQVDLDIPMQGGKVHTNFIAMMGILLYNGSVVGIKCSIPLLYI